MPALIDGLGFDIITIMPNKSNEYYFIDIDLDIMAVVNWGETSATNHTGDTNSPNVHRVFLTRGQFNKLKRKLV